MGKPLSAEQLEAKNEKDAQTIERYRVRARYLAGLSGTGAAAVAAGLVFGSAPQNIPNGAYASGVAAAVFLLASLAAYAYAQTVTGARKITAEDWQKDPSTKTVHYIRQGTFWGTIAGGLAVVCLVAMLVISVMTIGESTVEGRFFLSDAGMSRVHATCPEIGNPIAARVSSEELQDGRAWLALKVRATNCQPLGGSPVLSVARKDIAGWVLDD